MNKIGANCWRYFFALKIWKGIFSPINRLVVCTSCGRFYNPPISSSYRKGGPKSKHTYAVHPHSKVGERHAVDLIVLQFQWK